MPVSGLWRSFFLLASRSRSRLLRSLHEIQCNGGGAKAKHMRRHVAWRRRSEAATMEIVIDEHMLCLVGRSAFRSVGHGKAAAALFLTLLSLFSSFSLSVHCTLFWSTPLRINCMPRCRTVSVGFVEATTTPKTTSFLIECSNVYFLHGVLPDDPACGQRHMPHQPTTCVYVSLKNHQRNLASSPKSTLSSLDAIVALRNAWLAQRVHGTSPLDK